MNKLDKNDIAQWLLSQCEGKAFFEQHFSSTIRSKNCDEKQVSPEGNRDDRKLILNEMSLKEIIPALEIKLKTAGKQQRQDFARNIATLLETYPSDASKRESDTTADLNYTKLCLDIEKLSKTEAGSLVTRILQKYPFLEHKVFENIFSTRYALELEKILTGSKERHSHLCKLEEILWLSVDAIPHLVSYRHDIVGKLLEVYHGEVKLIHNENKGALTSMQKSNPLLDKTKGSLTKIFLLFSEHDPTLMETMVQRNRFLLRNLLENSDIGRDILGMICTSSLSIIEKVITSGKGKLGYIFYKNLELFNDVLAQAPSLLLAVAEEYPLTMTHIFQHDPMILVNVCQKVPEILFSLIDCHPGTLISVLLQKPKVIFDSLRQMSSANLVDHLKEAENGDVLLNRQSVLDGCNLLNLSKYRRDESRSIGIQTIPIRTTKNTNQIVRTIPDIIGKKRLKSSLTSSNVYSVEQLLTHMGEIYAQKITADIVDLKAGHEPEPLCETVVDYFSDMDRVQSRKNLQHIFAAIRKYSSKRIVYWFGVATGCINEEYFNPRCAEILLFLINTLLPTECLEDAFGKQAESVVVPFSNLTAAILSAVDILWAECEQQKKSEIMSYTDNLQKINLLKKYLFRHRKAWVKLDESLQPLGKASPAKQGEISQRKGQIDDETETKKKMLRKVIEKTKVMHALKFINTATKKSEPRKSDEVECVFLHDGIDILLTNWLESEEAKVDSLVALYKEADTNGDGTLDFSEFQELVKQIYPNCDVRTIKRMFKHTGETTDTGEQSISPREFVEVIRTIT